MMGVNHKYIQRHYNPDNDVILEDDDGEEEQLRNPLKKKNTTDLEIWDYMVGSYL